MVYIYEQETSVCMCCTVTKKQNTEFIYAS